MSSMQFSEFIAPMSAEQFRQDHYGIRPLHIPAGPNGHPRGKLLTPERLSELLSAPSHWSEDNLKVILNSAPVLPEFYLGEVSGPPRGGRANAAKLQMFVDMGASLVANYLEDIAPEIRDLTSMLGAELGGKAGANAYASSRDIRAFDTHCDLHEVFAVQMEGVKTWRIYRNRAESPVETLEGPDAQDMIHRVKGPVEMTVELKAGDLLYIPRGFYHDALASSEKSLHLTIAVRPLDGRYVFHLLEEMTTRDREFRDYLPEARTRSGADLREHLQRLSEKIGQIVQSPLFASEIAARQRSLAWEGQRVNLSGGKSGRHFGRTNVSAEVAWDLDGAALVVSGRREPLGELGKVAEWALQQRAFSNQQLAANYPWLTGQEVEWLIALLQELGLFAVYEPKV